MRINNLAYNHITFRAYFAKDTATTVFKEKALQEAPVKLYALHKIIKEIDTEDTYTLSDNCKTGDYSFRNNTTQKK